MKSNRSIPAAQIIPELGYPDVPAAADWLCKAFGFQVRLRIGGHRIQLVLGNGAVVVRNGAPAADSGASHSTMVRVNDIDAHYARAIAAGAVASGAPTTYPYGERQYGARDFAGHAWVFTESVADVHPKEWGGELELST